MLIDCFDEYRTRGSLSYDRIVLFDAWHNHSGARQVSGKILGFGFQTGSQMLVKRRQVVRITSGSETLDTLLGGGTVVVYPLFLSQLLI